MISAWFSSCRLFFVEPSLFVVGPFRLSVVITPMKIMMLMLMRWIVSLNMCSFSALPLTSVSSLYICVDFIAKAGVFFFNLVPYTCFRPYVELVCKLCLCLSLGQLFGHFLVLLVLFIIMFVCPIFGSIFLIVKKYSIFSISNITNESVKSLF